MHTKSSFADSGSNGTGIGIDAGAIVDSATATADKALSGVSREVKNLLTDIEDLVTSTTSLTGEDLARAKAKLSVRLTQAKASVEKMGSDIVTQARHGAKVTDTYVHEQPWQAIGIGAGVGAALGVVLGFALARR